MLTGWRVSQWNVRDYLPLPTRGEDSLMRAAPGTSVILVVFYVASSLPPVLIDR